MNYNVAEVVATSTNQGRRNRSGCSGFGWSSFSQGKSKIPFLQKASNKQSASVILGLIKLIILSYNR